MWVNKILFNTVLADNKALSEKLTAWQNTCHVLQTKHDDALAQKAKDDITIGWMIHRINALEKQNAILLQKAAGVAMPVPEIVPTRPGSMTVSDFTSMPSFEDVGEDEARRLGVAHDDLGFLKFQEDMKTVNNG